MAEKIAILVDSGSDLPEDMKKKILNYDHEPAHRLWK